MTDVSADRPQPHGLSFPCHYPVKVMVASGGRAAVLSVVGRHADFSPSRDVRSRSSRNGRFEAITVTVAVETRAQLEALYADLNGVDAVKMML